MAEDDAQEERQCRLRHIVGSGLTTGRSKSWRATSKRDYYCQSRRGNRLFELGLGEVALALCAASSKADQAAIAEVFAGTGRTGFAAAWLRRRGLTWVAEMLGPVVPPFPAAPRPPLHFVESMR